MLRIRGRNRYSPFGRVARIVAAEPIVDAEILRSEFISERGPAGMIDVAKGGIIAVMIGEFIFKL